MRTLNIEENKKIGRALKKLRKSGIIKLTQKDVADQLEISQHHYSKIENGKVNFALPLLKKLSKTFKISIDDLIKISDKT